MRYLISAKVKPGQGAELLRALKSREFTGDFPYGDLGETLLTGRVDPSGTIRWVEVCYCREYYGVAMAEELPYFERFLTDMAIADARAPRGCTGYPDCNDCDCTNKVRPKGEQLEDHLRRLGECEQSNCSVNGRPTRWLGWRGEVTAEEAVRNEGAREQ